MAFSGVIERGSATEKAFDTSLAVSPTANIVVGKIAWLYAITDNLGSVDGATTDHTTLADTDGNTWNKVFERSRAPAAGAGVTHSLWWAKVDTQIDTTDSITLTVSAALTAKVLMVFECTITGTTIQIANDGTPSAFHEANGTSPSATTSGMTSQEYLHIGCVGEEEEVLLWTEDADYTNVFASEGVSSGPTGTTISNVTGFLGYRIATLTGDTFAPTVTIADFACALIAFEEVTSGTALVEIKNETIEISEAVQRHVGLTRVVNESLEISEALQIHLARVRLMNESVEISEALQRHLAIIRLQAETVEISETSIKVGGLIRQIGETVNISEETAKVGGLLRQINESVEIGETTVRVLGQVQVHNETIELTETTLNFLGKIQVVDEGLELFEAVSRHVGLVRIRNESVEVSEQVLRTMALARVINESVQIVEQTLRLIGIVRLVSESVELQEQAMRVMAQVRVVLEDVQISETTIHLGGLIVIRNETLNITEQVLKFTSDASLGSSRIRFRAKVNDQVYKDSVIDSSKAKVRE